MKHLFFVLGFCLLAFGAPGGEPLFENGKSGWNIIIPENAAPPEIYAAEELRGMLKKISGAEIPVRRSDSVPGSRHIVIGSLRTSPAIRRLETELKLKDGPVEHLAVQTLDGNLYLAGNHPRGALYAVYSFLRNALDVRWFWYGDDGEFYPSLAKYTLPELNWNYKPSLRFREMTPCYEQRHEASQIWLARNFLNGGARTKSIRDNGGFVRSDGQHWVELKRRDFDKYPEYFSMIGGKRVPEGLAGCWTNPGFLKLMVEKHLRLIKENDFEIMKTIHSDITQRCECAECTKNPDPSSRWFDFYAKLAAELHKTYPDVLFAASAYQEHRSVPKDDIKGILYVEYCHYNRCYVHKLDNPDCKYNQQSMTELKRWQKKIPMAVYGYELDVFEPFLYVPLWNMLADEMKVFRDMGVIRVKTELPVITRKAKKRTDIIPQKMRLSNYLYAQLAWNPDADPDALLRDFCKKVYGGGADAMYAYHKAMADSWDNMKIHLSYFLSKPGGASAHLLNDKLISLARKKFAEAKNAAAQEKDPVKQARILADIAVDEAAFADWEKLYRVIGAPAVVCLPKLPEHADFKSLKKFPMTPKWEKSLPTETRMYWDDSALHIQVTCLEPEMAKLRKGSTGRDVPLWTDDNIELFLDLNDGQPYRHLAANPSGGTFDAMGSDLSWNPQWRTKTLFLPDRWVMEITLPFESFGGNPPKTGDQWKAMIIRNSKPGACGYPEAVHHDMSRAATLYFSQNSDNSKNLLWLGSPGVSRGKRFEKAVPDLLKSGWQFENALKAPEILRKDPSDAGMIVVETYRSEIPLEYYRNRVIPAVKNGAVLVFSSYFGLDSLPQIFGDESYRVNFKENATGQIRKITSVRDTSFASEPHELRKILRFLPSGTLEAAAPEKWEVLACQQTKDGGEAPFLIARPLGKGMVVIAGDIKENVALLENILKYNKKIKR